MGGGPVTTILYDGNGGLHGDRMRGQHRHEASKVRRLRGGALIGASGSTGECLRLEHFIEKHCDRNPAQWPELPKAQDGVMAIYVHRDGSVWLIDPTNYPIPMDRDRPLTVGSGGDIALGAFVVSGNVVAAMSTAHRFDRYTGETFDSVLLEGAEMPEPA